MKREQLGNISVACDVCGNFFGVVHIITQMAEMGELFHEVGGQFKNGVDGANEAEIEELGLVAEEELLVAERFVELGHFGSHLLVQHLFPGFVRLRLASKTVPETGCRQIR